MGAVATRGITPITIRPKPGLVFASGLLLATMLGNNVCNYLFHAIASRRLGPSDYGALVSMLALLTLLGIPSQAIQTVVAQRAAVEDSGERHPHITALLTRLLRYMLVAGGFCALLLAVLSPWLARFFRLSSPGPVIVVGVTILVTLGLAVVRGWLQGWQRFGSLGSNVAIDGVFRLGSGLAIFSWGGKVALGLFATTLAGSLAFGAGWLALRPGKPDPAIMIGPEDWGALYRGWVPMVVALGAFTALSTLDVILVKHYFVPQLAGYYGAGSMVGKAFVFVGLALAQVMFPKASAAHARAEDSRHLLLKSLGLTAGFLTVSIVLTWGLATLIIRTLFGLQFLNPHTLFLIKGMGLAMTPLALVYVVLQYNLALQSRRFIHVLLADVLLLAGLLAFIHPSLEAVLWLVGLNHLGLLLAGLLTLPGTGKAAA